MENIFDLKKFNKYKEDNRREIKNATGGLPNSIWETYSAFANSEGGVIILGVDEKNDGSWEPSGLKNGKCKALIRDFWNAIHNMNKVSLVLVNDDDLKEYNVGENKIVVINIPAAKRSQKPVYINDDLFDGTYIRNFDGDYKCTKEQVKAMLRDQSDESIDSKVLRDFDIAVFEKETIEAYRNRHRLLKLDHPFNRLDNNEFLCKIGAAIYDDKNNKYHPTAAGLLMFGNESDIVREFNDYFLDYQEVLDPTIKWTDRLYSSSGDWTGNVFDFYFKTYNKLIKNIKAPFDMIRGNRIDDLPIYKAIREALANCIINADYYGHGGVVIKIDDNQITMSNPGNIRVGKRQMLIGGVSDPRNVSLMKMFNLISIGERAGSGVIDIFNIWNDEKLRKPKVIETINPDRTMLILPLDAIIEMQKNKNEKSGLMKKNGGKKAAKKTGEKDRRKKPAKKTGEKRSAKKTNGKILAEKDAGYKIEQQINRVIKYMKKGTWYKRQDLEKELGLKESRTKEILKNLVDNKLIITRGSTKAREYCKKE